MDHSGHMMQPVALSQMVAVAKSEHLPFPVIVTPPGAPGRFGRKAGSDWTVRSDTQNRPQRVTIKYDAMTGQEKSREVFADKHVIDRVVGYGVAWHEGQLFGWINQLIGVLTALMLVTMSVTGFVMWRRRKPVDRLGALPASHTRLRDGRVWAAGAVLALLLPLFTLSLVVLWLFDRLVLPRAPRLAAWLGV